MTIGPAFFRNGIVALALGALLCTSFIACEEPGVPATDPAPTDPAPTDDGPAATFTNSIEFSGGTVRAGLPPAATDNPNDPQLSGAPLFPATLAPGDQGNMAIDVVNLPADTDFEVNIRFGDADGDADRYVSVPVSSSMVKRAVLDAAPGTLRTASNGTVSGTLNLPFTAPRDICAGLKAQRHRLSCCESIDVGGISISREQAREIILNCDDTEIEDGRYCIHDYPVPVGPSADDVEQAIRAIVDADPQFMDVNYHLDIVVGPGRDKCGPGPFVKIRDSSSLGSAGGYRIAIIITASDIPAPVPIPIQCRRDD